MPSFRRFVLLPLVFLTAPAAAQTSPPSAVEARLAQAGPGIRFGLLVVDAQGHEIVAIRPDERFQPASTTKLVTTAAAFALLPVNDPDASGGAVVRLEGEDVVLEGHGDARLSSAADCAVDCLATLADAVARRTRVVGDVIGDDRAFLDLRWSPGMSWNNIGTRSGAAVSALTLDDNQGAAHVAPGEVATVVPRSIGLDDPAEEAARRFRTMLEARGVQVRGVVRVRHRSSGADPTDGGGVLARLVPPPLLEDLRHTNKTSDNLHAELLLRRLGRGDIEAGGKAVAALLAQAGVPGWSYSFADGSGMSAYNRVTPRAMVTFLRWASGQPWGPGWWATLPVGGVDGTLSRRFRDGPLAGRLTAKTGTLAGTHALAGTLQAASGAVLTFAFFAGDAPLDARPVPAMDAVLAIVAAQN